MASDNPHEAANVLVARAKAGDQAAFGALVRRYRSRIFALALHLSGRESDADDITQEVFLSAYKALPRFEGRSAFFTWVYRMTVNRALNVKRNRKRRGETPMDDPRVARALEVDAPDNPARAALLRQTYALLLAELDRLPAPMKTSVVLVSLQGLSHAEAAVVQNCSPGTIAWRMHEARRRLRISLEPQEKPRLRRNRKAPLSKDLSKLLSDWELPLPRPL